MELTIRARLRAGDPAAFGALYDSCAGAVHRHAVRWTGDWSAAEDVVSLTFLEAWRLLPEGDNALPWLLGDRHQRLTQQGPRRAPSPRGPSAARSTQEKHR